jgi:hypothetical protein
VAIHPWQVAAAYSSPSQPFRRDIQLLLAIMHGIARFVKNLGRSRREDPRLFAAI